MDDDERRRTNDQSDNVEWEDGRRRTTKMAVRGQRGVMPDPSLGLDCVMGRDGDAAGDLSDG